MPRKKPNKYKNDDTLSDKIKGKKYVKDLEDDYLKRYNNFLPLNRLVLLHKNYDHIKQLRDFLICKAAKGERNIIIDKEEAKLGDLYVDKKGKLECFLGYKWLIISDINNKEFIPEKKLVEKLENFKSSDLFKARKYKLPKDIMTILKEKAYEINTLANGKKNIRDKFIDQGICNKLKQTFQYASILFFEKYEEKIIPINDNKAERRKFGQEMKVFCLEEVDKKCEKLKLKIKQNYFKNKKIQDKKDAEIVNLKNAFKPKLPEYENKNYTLTEKAFLLKYIAPKGYYPWHRLASNIIEKSKTWSGKQIFQVFSAPAYYLTDELTNAFLLTSVKNLKLDKKPKIINNQFFVFNSEKINLINYLYIDTAALFHDVEVLCWHKKGHNETRFMFGFNWNDLDNIKINDISKAANSPLWINKENKYNLEDLPALNKEAFFIVINLILFMNQEPDITLEYLSPSVITKPKNNKEDNATYKPRAITWIGKEFTKRTIKLASNNGEIAIKQGCRPVRSHWRRGHWHTVLQGFKRQQRKMKWYKPVFVRGNKL